MLFNSYIFVLLFLPLTLTGYFLCNKFNKHSLGKAYLLGMSLWFYAYFNISYLPIILGSILINYGASKLMHHSSQDTTKKIILISTLLANIWVLFYFKYFNFFILNINTVFQPDFILKKLILPLGISFFTFQQLSYIIDSYYKKMPDYPFLEYALFVTFFPQLIAGPIVTHDEIVPQFCDDKNSYFQFDNFSKGLYAFSLGLFKKVLVADTFGKAVAWGFGDVASLDSTSAIIVMLSYTLQIYFDFSGYCDMATGIGLMFNITIPKNFNSPYKALTITDFWNRWHITLTRFFTRYVYIPIGGSRKGHIRTYMNILIVFLVSGLWHGANWTFILWGAMHGAFSLITRIFSNLFEKIPKAINWLITFTFVNIAWIYFRADSISQANKIVKTIFSFNFGKISSSLSQQFVGLELDIFRRITFESFFTQHEYIFVLVTILLAIIAVVFFKNTNDKLESFKPTVWNALLVPVLLILSIVSFEGVSTFLYFNF